MKHQDLPRVLRRAVGLMRFAREAVGASAASLFLVDPAEDALRGLVSEWDWTRTSFPSALGDWPTVRDSLVDGRHRWISATDARGGEAGWFEERGIQGTLCVPMRAGRTSPRPLGVLFFDFESRHVELGRAEKAVLRDVGRRCARALVRALEAAPPAEDRWVH